MPGRFNKEKQRAGETLQHFRALDLKLQAQESVALFWLLLVPDMHTMHKHACRHTRKTQYV